MGHQCVLTHREKDEWAISAYLLREKDEWAISAYFLIGNREKDEWAINAYLLIGRRTNGSSVRTYS